jgi:hypothetical protein
MDSQALLRELRKLRAKWVLRATSLLRTGSRHVKAGSWGLSVNQQCSRSGDETGGPGKLTGLFMTRGIIAVNTVATLLA